MDGRIGYARTLIADALHGDREGRRYGSRHEILLRQSFHPARDLSASPDGPLEWASDKREMHDDVREYFRLRAQDESPDPEALPDARSGEGGG